MHAEIIRKKHKKRKNDRSTPPKKFNQYFLLKKKLNLSFFLAFLDHIYPLTNPLYVINFSKKLFRIIYKFTYDRYYNKNNCKIILT